MTSSITIGFTGTSNACSSVRIYVYLDGSLQSISAFFGAGQSISPIALGNVSPGTHTVGLQGEGEVGGCNPGSLLGWGGTLSISQTPTPVITSLTPSPVVAGSGAFTLTVSGTGFASGATILWNGTALPTTFVSATQLTASVAASFIASPGSASITVSSGGVTSSAATLSFTTLLTNLVRIGVLPQLAAGAGWDTAIYLTNTTGSAAAITLVFHADDGSSLSIPISATQQGKTQTLVASSLNATIAPNTTLTVDTGSLGATVQGWADVLSNGTVTGFAVFRYAPQGLSGGAGVTVPWEGTVYLQTQLSPTSMIVPFDNTNGFATGVAVGNLTGSLANLTATFYDDNGNVLGTALAFTLAGNGHTAFVVSAQYPFTNNLKGIMKITGGPLMGLGLRGSPYGTLTSVPVPLQ